LTLDSFSPDYSTARRRFRQAVIQAGGKLESIGVDVKGPEGEELSIDIGWFGSDEPRSVVLHSTGLHGVEGFAGSAVQLQFLEDPVRMPPGSAIVLTHILNPYGMAWLRRVNENNVDLNRNFLSDDSYSGAPSEYARLNSFLNPSSPPAVDLFALRALLLLARYGMEPLKQSILEGQYDFPKGLFFGGKRLQQPLKRYHVLIEQMLTNVNTIIAIDVHTGIGPYGQDSLLVNRQEYERLRTLFGERVRAMEPDRGPGYRIRGGLSELITHALPHAEIDFVGQEFGTYGPTKVLHALREENRWHHYGGSNLHHPSKYHLKRIFCPDDASWRHSVLTRGQELLAQAIQILLAS